MAKMIKLRFRDRISVSVSIRIETSKTIGDLKAQVAKCIGREMDQVILKRGKRELVDMVDIDTYELVDEECIEIEYK